jgi:hypothetical protein
LDDLDARWEALIGEIEEFSRSSLHDELQVAQLSVKIGSLHLVQPFNWASWNAPFPLQLEFEYLSLADCVGQITRLVRLNRVSEGVLARAAADGDLMALVVQARKQAGGKAIPNVVSGLV